MRRMRESWASMVDLGANLGYDGHHAMRGQLDVILDALHQFSLLFGADPPVPASPMLLLQLSCPLIKRLPDSAQQAPGRSESICVVFQVSALDFTLPLPLSDAR